VSDSSKPAVSLLKVLLLVRNARSTEKAERALLIAIALRCKPKDNWRCWPSYEMLAKDTLLSESALKMAAKKLEKVGLIRRVVRHNRSNVFIMNVDLLQEQAAKERFPPNRTLGCH
jgi:DNA-binding MarR family transcriptional regulator